MVSSHTDGHRDPYGRYDVPDPPETPRLTIWPRKDVVRGTFYVCPSCGNPRIRCQERTCEGGESGQFYKEATDEVIAKWSCSYDKGDAPRHLHVCCDNCKHVFAIEPAKKAPSASEDRFGYEVAGWTIFGVACWAAGFLSGWSLFG